MKEDILQINLVLFIRHNYPGLLFWHTPSGGYRHKMEASKFKRMGTIPGVPDLFFPSLKLFLELKTEKGKVSKVQKEVMAKLSACGYRCEVAYGLDEAKQIINSLHNH